MDVKRALYPALCALVLVRWCFSAAPVQPQGNWHGWSVEGAGKVASHEGAFLLVEYDSPERRAVVLRPPAPAALPPGLTRIGIWFASVRGDVDVTFLVSDANGREYRAGTYATKQQGPEIRYDPRRRIEWPLWTQAESKILRFPDQAAIARRVLPEFRDAAQKAVWPEPWTLTGIALEPVTHRDRRWGGGFTRAQYDDMTAGRGAVWLTHPVPITRTSHEADFFSALEERLRWARDEQQVLFLDDLTTAGGTVAYAIEVRDGYQGAVVWRHEGQGVLDRADPVALYESRVALPRLRPGDYWVRTWTWDGDGRLGQARLLRWFVFEGDAGTRSGSTPFGWHTAEPHNVFPCTSRTADLLLTVGSSAWRRAPAGAICRVTVTDWRGRSVLTESLEGEGRHVVACPVAAGHDYFAEAEVCAEGVAYHRAYLHFGVANAPAEAEAASTVPSTVPARDEFLNGRAHLQSEYRHNDIFSRDYPWVQDFDPADFELFVQQAKQVGSRTITVGACLGDIAILPGVFRWAHLDEQIEIAARHGLGVVLNYIMGTADGRTCPLWIPRTPFLGQFGNAFPGVPGTSHWNAAWDEARLDYYRRLAGRYLGNPNVIGYQVKNYCLTEQFVGEFRTADYSRPARDAFQAWQRSGGLDPLPLPGPFNLPLRNPYLGEFGPDLSPEWVRFLDFNVHAGTRFSTRLLDAIRSVDPKRHIQLDRKHICYAVENLIPELRDRGALKNEGSPGFRDIPLRSLAEQAGVPFLEELHRQIPTSPSIADATYFYSSYLSRTIFWLFRWKPEHVEDKRHPMFRTLEHMLDYVEKAHPRWEEYIRAQEPEPEVLVFGSRADHALGAPHRGEFTSMAGIDVLEALFVTHNVPAHFCNEYSDWVDPARFRLLFVAGEVMREPAVARVLRAARGGSKVVFIGSAGRFCPERVDERDLLSGPLVGLENVRTLPVPVPIPDSGGRSWPRVKGFPREDLEDILSWAGVRRRISAVSTSGPGFQCILRESADRTRVYAAVMRTWNGTFYRGEIEFQETLAETYGQSGGTVSVRGLVSGPWRVEKIHRDSRDLGVRSPTDDELAIPLDPAFVGEVQLYRLTRLDE